MRPPHHRLPHDAMRALAAGSGGAELAREFVKAAYSRHVLLVKGVADTAESLAMDEGRAVRRAYRILVEVHRAHPDAVTAVLRHPAVGAWALNTLIALEAEDARSDHWDAHPDWLAGVAAAAAVRAGHPVTIEVPILAETVTLPSLGQASLPGQKGRALVRSAPGRAEVVSPRSRVVVPARPELDAPGWLGLRRLTARHGELGLSLLIDDLDPHRFPIGYAPRLTDAQAQRWESMLRDAWAILAEHHWTTAAEIQATIGVLTPLAAVDSGHHQISATSAEVFGCTALSPPGDGRTLAVTLAHEVQHTKLIGLLEFVTLTHDDDGRRFYAPWRDDPRPAAGLLQGAYAHLGVSGFWRRQRHVETGVRAVFAHAEFARWTMATRAVGRSLLRSGCLTEDGRTFVECMLHTLDAWSTEVVPPAASTIARRKARRHRERWLLRNQSPGRRPDHLVEAFDGIDEGDR